ncbi:hypothetical protein CKA32_004821 [Geitlerinema sp. FC II]|nr:hypothetical protein CKA32_004821 [Geitlerinema sp. FC II]
MPSNVVSRESFQKSVFFQPESTICRLADDRLSVIRVTIALPNKN